MKKSSKFENTYFAIKPKHREQINQLNHVLEREKSWTKLVTEEGDEINIPEEVYQLLRYSVSKMASGQGIHLLSESPQLTIQETADWLNVSRPYLINLLDQGEIPYIKVGTHRRVNLEDILKYQEKREHQRRQILDELIVMTSEAGLYQIDEELK
jgi:excisionase family DNA binding protein